MTAANNRFNEFIDIQDDIERRTGARTHLIYVADEDPNKATYILPSGHKAEITLLEKGLTIVMDGKEYKYTGLLNKIREFTNG